MHSCKPKPCTKNDLSLQQNHEEPCDALQSDTNNCTNIVFLYGTAFQLNFFKKSKLTISNVYISFMYFYANIYQDGDAGRGGSNSMVDRQTGTLKPVQ